MVGFIYKYENRINHKVYIGQTTDLINRKSSHRYKATFVKSKFYNAVRKYGWDNFEFSILSQIEADTFEHLTSLLDKLESEYIIQYDSFNKGYNSTTGGHSYRGKEVSDEYREYCRNRVYSEETRRKMSIANSNRIVTPETKNKLKELAIKNNIVERLNCDIEKRSLSVKKALSKPVLQIDKNNTIVNEFPSIKEAACFVLTYIAPDKTFLGIEHGIHRHCTLKTKKRYYYGFEWKFKTNV